MLRSDFVQQHAVDCTFQTSDSWVILSPIEQSIKTKIEAVGIPLKEWDIQINYGIKTGYNEAFIISTEKREEILNKCATEDERSRTAELIRPILRGRDIKRYGYYWADLWLINIHNGIKNKVARIQIDDFPALKAHLDKHKEQIVARADKGDTPYNLRNCAYMEDFSKPKIVWAELARTGNAFTIDVNHLMVGNTGYILTVENNELDTLFYLLAFLNSKYMLYSLNQISTRLDETGWRWLRQFVEILRVPKTTRECELIRLTKSMLKQRVEKTQEQINVIIYDIFGFSEREREYIDAQLLRY